MPEGTGVDGSNDVLLEHGVDAVGADDHVGLGRRAVGERQPRAVGVLLEAGGAVAGNDGAAGQRRGEELDEVGAVHPVDGFLPLASELTGAIGVPSCAEVRRVRADARAGVLDRGAEPEALELADGCSG